MRPRSARQLATEGAKKSLQLSILFKALFGQRTLGAYLPALVEPEGVSTAGGAQARQPITLTKKGERGSVLTMGAVDAAAQSCMLRTYDCLARMHAQRFGEQPFELDRHGYATLFVEISETMRRRAFTVTIENEPAAAVDAPREPPAAALGWRKNRRILLGLALLALLALTAVVLLKS